MTLLTKATTIETGDFDRREGMAGGILQVVADTNNRPDVANVGREGVLPYLTTLTLITGLLALWAELCAI